MFLKLNWAINQSSFKESLPHLCLRNFWHYLQQIPTEILLRCAYTKRQIKTFKNHSISCINFSLDPASLSIPLDRQCLRYLIDMFLRLWKMIRNLLCITKEFHRFPIIIEMSHGQAPQRQLTRNNWRRWCKPFGVFYVYAIATIKNDQRTTSYYIFFFTIPFHHLFFFHFLSQVCVHGEANQR